MQSLLRLGIVKWVYYIIGVLTIIFALWIRDESTFIAWTLIVIGILLISHGYIASILEGTISFILAEHSEMKDVESLKAVATKKKTAKRKPAKKRATKKK